MNKQNQYVLYILEKLQPHGPITSRAMFGGYGIYYGDVIFGLVVEDQLYFRADEQSQEEFKKYSSTPFIYEGQKGKTVSMPYWTLPEEILENANLLPIWIERSCQISIKSRKPKKAKK